MLGQLRQTQLGGCMMISGIRTTLLVLAAIGTAGAAFAQE
jgi:hypothetical protein